MNYIKLVLFQIRFIFQEDIMGPNILLKKILKGYQLLLKQLEICLSY